MCKGKPDCKCPRQGAKINLAKSEYREEMLEGKKHLVVPVVLARSDVVMNEGLVPEEEMLPMTWNGVPVTVQHPSTADGGFLSANSPRALEDWCVGRIFNASVSQGILRGEAWIAIDKADQISNTLIETLKDASLSVDVSTGYFCDAEPASGELNGRSYVEVHRNLRPDHLALLPGAVGACNWEDGCGVRANRRNWVKNAGAILSSVAAALGLKTEVSDGSIKVHTAPPEGTPEDEKEDKTDPADKAEGEGEEEVMNDATKTAINDAVSAAVKEALSPTALSTAINAAVGDAVSKLITPEDRAALSHARNASEQRRADLITRIKTNSTMTDDELKGLSDNTLEAIARSLPAADFSGRAVGNSSLEPGDDKAALEMGATGVVNIFTKKKA